MKIAYKRSVLPDVFFAYPIDSVDFLVLLKMKSQFDKE